MGVPPFFVPRRAVGIPRFRPERTPVTQETRPPRFELVLDPEQRSQLGLE